MVRDVLPLLLEVPAVTVCPFSERSRGSERCTRFILSSAIEIRVRTIRARRPGGGEVLVDEYWTMVDHSPRHDGSDYLPGPRGLALRTGSTVQRLDECTFQITSTAEVLVALGEVSPFES